VAADERRADESGVGQQDVGALPRVQGHDRLVLGSGGSDEDVFDVEGEGLGALEGDALGEGLGQVLPVVEVCLFRQGHVLGAGVAHGLHETRAGQESDPVAALSEPASDAQQGSDVPVDRDGRDDDGCHDSPRRFGDATIQRHLIVFTAMR
jgi:hypothetical protein